MNAMYCVCIFSTVMTKLNKDEYLVDYSLVLLIHAGELSNTNTYQVRNC